MDFVMDALANGRRLKCLTIVDDFTRECLDIPVDHGISGAYAARVLDRIGQFRSLPRAIRTDQGPEFTSRALDRWAYERGVNLKLIAAGKPTREPRATVGFSRWLRIDKRHWRRKDASR